MPNQPTQGFSEMLVAACQKAVAASAGRLRLAHKEQNSNSNVRPGAGHFLKLDGARISSDLEEFYLFAKATGTERSLEIFRTDIESLRESCPEAHEALIESLSVRTTAAPVPA